MGYFGILRAHPKVPTVSNKRMPRTKFFSWEAPAYVLPKLYLQISKRILMKDHFIT